MFSFTSLEIWHNDWPPSKTKGLHYCCRVDLTSTRCPRTPGAHPHSGNNYGVSEIGKQAWRHIRMRIFETEIQFTAREWAKPCQAHHLIAVFKLPSVFLVSSSGDIFNCISYIDLIANSGWMWIAKQKWMYCPYICQEWLKKTSKPLGQLILWPKIEAWITLTPYGYDVEWGGRELLSGSIQSMCFEGLRKTRKTSVMIGAFPDENKEKNTVSVRDTRENEN